MGHNHSHNHSTGNIKVAFFINLAFTVIELVGGMFTNSIAIVSDALHDLCDSIALGLAWYLEKKATSENASATFTFGYARFRLLGALINALILVGGSIYIIIEAVGRFQNPEPVKSLWMMGIAIIGVAANSYAAWRTSGSKSLNEKVISWHLLEDVLGWVAVLIVSIILQFKDWYFLDPALSIGVTVFILVGVGRRLWETIHLLLQGVPSNIKLAEIESLLSNVEQVKSVHHTHVWSLDGEQHVLTTHIVIDGGTELSVANEVRENCISVLHQFNFTHHTIQVESAGVECMN